MLIFFWHNPAPTLVGVAGPGGVEWTHDRWLFGGLHPGVTMLFVLPWRRFGGKTKQAGGVTEVVITLSSCDLEFLVVDCDSVFYTQSALRERPTGLSIAWLEGQ